MTYLDHLTSPVRPGIIGAKEQKARTVFVHDHLEALKSSMTQPGSWNRAHKVSDWVQSLNIPDAPPAIARLDHRMGRKELRNQCRNERSDVLVGYLCTMAWGGQHRRYARAAWEQRTRLSVKLTALRDGNLSRTAAFDLFTGDGAVPGLGVAFFTKLLFFFREAEDAYILDQWTGKSINLLCGQEVVPFDANAVSRRMTANHYARYCSTIEDLGTALGTTPAEAEALLLSEGGRRPAPWRAHVLRHSRK